MSWVEFQPDMSGLVQVAGVAGAVEPLHQCGGLEAKTASTLFEQRIYYFQCQSCSVDFS